ncbi:MAG: anthranilate synthase component I [Actinobacteria bacterium]|nr:anthranilate synthase component I [Actinomycetota bacterium]
METVRPGLDEFLALSREYTVVPVWREVLADLETPVSAFLKLVGSGEGFLLESVEHGEHWGRYSFIGRDPLLTLILRDGSVTFEGSAPAGVPAGEGALAALEALLTRFRAPRLEALPPFHGGIVGYLGYDVVREIERLPGTPPDDLGAPDAVMSVTGHVAAFDHFAQRLYLIENVFLDPAQPEAERVAAYEGAAARLQALVDDLAQPLPYRPLPPPTDEQFTSGDAEMPAVVPNRSADDFRRAVEVAKEYILAGDIFQVVLSQRFDVTEAADPFEVYRVLRQLNPSPYMYFLRHPEVTLVGSSPEPMVQLLSGRVVSRPIAGTRWRGRSDAHDRRLAAELSEDPKERAEHVMLVDLARNDVGRVVDFGSLTVDELMTVERYSHVMHLTSQVSGALAEGRGPVDVLRATFPAGTVSGAPKVRAMEIIDELEPTKRGPYAGVVGYFDFSGNLDTAITIRTIVCRNGRASVQAGAGIVADSDPGDEHLECQNKARALLAAIATAAKMAPTTA